MVNFFLKKKKKSPKSYLDRRLPRDISHQKVEGDVLAVHVAIHPLPYSGGRAGGVEEGIVLVVHGGARQHHGHLGNQGTM